jgi:hypothetical protein
MRLHTSTKIAMAVSGILTFLAVGLVSFAFLSIRSTPESPGAEPIAYVIVGVAVLIGSLMVAAMTGAVVAGIRRIFRRGSRV